MANESGTFWMPPQKSTVAPDVDALFDFIYVLNVFFLLLIAIGTVYFVWKYRRKSDDQLAISQMSHNTPIEAIWTFGPLILCIVVFVWSFRVYLDLAVAPAGAYEVRVTGEKWKWTMQHPNGAKLTNKLHAPAGKPVKIILGSKDVLHSFFVPDFRIKQDAVPGRYTTLWFQADEPGEYQVFCAEYCGTGHSNMMAKVIVLPPDEFEKQAKKGFKTGKPDKPPTEWGKDLYTEYTCNACHSLDGSKRVGPSFKGLWGRTEKMQDGSEVKVDEEYLRESIMDSQAKIVAGYPPSMPTFQGQIDDDEMFAIIAFIKTLK